VTLGADLYLFAYTPKMIGIPIAVVVAVCGSAWLVHDIRKPPKTQPVVPDKPIQPDFPWSVIVDTATALIDDLHPEVGASVSDLPDGTKAVHIRKYQKGEGWS
jgi:hypothetical protein